VRQGGSVTLSVSAIGTAPLRYLWSFNGQPLAGATNVTYVIDSFDPTNAGTYSIQVQNGYASVKTNLTTLYLGNPPVITMQPADQTVTAGSNAVFTVQCSGSPPLVYQWALNATNLLGANSSSLTLSNVVIQQQGTITVLITNLFGATLSRSAMLEVLPGPSRLSLALTNGFLQFQLSVQANRQYSLLTASNLVDWVPVQPLSTSGTNLTLSLTLPQDPVRFYRLQDQTGP
jgi:hypothetical protein